jgi:hypothetical protein
MATSNDPNVNLANQISQSYPRASSTTKAAGIASGDANIANTASAVDSVSQTANALQQHQATYNSSGWWNNILKDTKDVATAVTGFVAKAPVIGTLAQWASKPLQEVQKDYKFIHSLWADQGPAAGILGTLGVIAGGALGAVAGPEGVALGASAASALERNILGRVVPNFKSSFDKSNDPNYNVSFGRDLAHGLSNVPGFGALTNTDKGFGQIVSGIADATLDFSVDPLAKLGKIYGKVKNGNYLAEAKDEAGNVMRDESGLPIVKATLPIASMAPSVEDFLKTAAPTVQNSSQLMAAYNNTFNFQFRAAVKDIAELKNPVDIQVKYKNSNITTPLANALAKADTEPEVLNVLGRAMYSKEFAQAATPTGALVLPTRTLGKMFSSKFGPEAIRSSAQATTLNEEMNFLLPKFSTVMVPKMETIVDKTTGEITTQQAVNEFGKPVLTAKVDQNGEVIRKAVAPVWARNPKQLPENIMNAMASKVRTFTGQKALSMNQDLMKQSGEKIDFSDPKAGVTVYDLLNYSMPSSVAKEYAAKVMTAETDNERRALLRAAQVEVLKAAGLPDEAGMLNKILSQVHRATFGDEITNGVYGFLDGKPLGTMEDANGVAVNAALDPSQRYLGAMIDLKSLHQAMRATKAYGILYNHADDFFTHYTNRVFAPLTLLSTGFGLRVSGAEALHQVIRRGLGDYLSNVVASSAEKYNYKFSSAAEKSKVDTAIAQALTEEEHAVLDKPNDILTSNGITKELAEREKGYKGLVQEALRASGSKASYNSAIQEVVDLKAKIHPVGWLASKFASSKIAPYSVRQKVEDLTRLHASLGTDGIPAGIAADHGASAEAAAKDNIDYLSQAFGHSKKPGEELAGLTPMDPHFKMYWAQNLSKIAKSEFHQDIASEYLTLGRLNPGISQESLWAKVQEAHTARLADPANYQEYRTNMDGLSRATADSFAREQVAQLRGLIKGADGTIHNEFIRNVANGRPTFVQDMKSLANEQWPLKVLGRQMKPGMENLLSKIQDVGYRTMVNPPMDFISRSPLFAHFYSEALRDSDTMKAMGLIDEDQAVRLAALRGVENMLPTIHNPALRSQFAVLHRNLLPFYFAQEQALKRVGRLVTSNPQAFRDFQMINQGINNPGFVHTDANGKKYIVYPLAGEFGNALFRGMQSLGMNAMSGLPESVTGSTSSLASVLPEMKIPGVGTFANMTLEQLANRFPALAGLADLASGGYPPKTLTEAMFPNSAMRNLWDALTMDQKQANVYNSINSAIAAAHYSGQLPADFASRPAFEQQQIMDKIYANAKSNLIIKGIFAFFAPLSVNVTNDYYTSNLQTLRSEYLNMIKSKDQGGLGLPLADALAKFKEEHGDNAVAYTVSATVQGTDGANVPISTQTLNWIKAHPELINDPKYSAAAAYLIPQNTQGGNVAKIENQLLADHLRSRRTPTDFMNAIYVAKGWSDVSADYQDYLKYMSAARDSNNRQALAQGAQMWNAYTANYALHNPIWYEDYTNKSRVINAYEVVSQLTKLQDAGKLPGDSQAQGIADLLTNYRDFKPQLDAQMINGKANALHSQMLNQWNSYLDQIAGANPNLVNVINGVFRKAVAKI